jgi:hypothetical protein
MKSQNESVFKLFDKLYSDFKQDKYVQVGESIAQIAWVLQNPE